MKPRPVKFAAPTMLQTRLQRWRSRFILGLLAVLFLALGGRALWMQTMQGQFLLAKGARQYEREVELPATRGKILDRNGAVLATSLPARSVWALPDKVDLADPRMIDLARLLGYKPAELASRIRDGEDFVFLRRQVELEVAERIRALHIKHVGLDREYKRYYPEGESTAQLVGFTGVEHHGQEGLELSFDSLLGGVPGKRRVFRDGAGQIIGGLEASQEPRDGRDLRLTIDTRIQFQAHQALKQAVKDQKAKAGAAVVLDARTGDVLALANWPSYDPNDSSRRAGGQIRNRAITDTFEPGSTAKPFTAAMALESGRYKPQSLFNVSEGKLTIGRETIHDSHRQRQPLTLEQVIQKSSNVGAAKIALDLPAESLYGVLTGAGFGEAPRIGFPGATAGVLRPYRKWKPIEHATTSYGHGFSVSLLQLARAYTIFGNNGELLPVNLFRPSEDDWNGSGRIVKVAARGDVGGLGLADPGSAWGRPLDTIRGTPVIRPETARSVRKMLEMAVDAKGTAPAAQVPGYRVGGKTGTAHKIDNGRYVKKYVSSFVGLAPMSDPRLIVAVMIDEPSAGKHYGGEVAAPLFSTIAYDALRTLQIAPDLPFDSRILRASAQGSDGSAGDTKGIASVDAKRVAAGSAKRGAAGAAKGGVAGGAVGSTGSTKTKTKTIASAGARETSARSGSTKPVTSAGATKAVVPAAPVAADIGTANAVDGKQPMTMTAPKGRT
jgi:cell division protein FtsI (penicillin-binding protein 3)